MDGNLIGDMCDRLERLCEGRTDAGGRVIVGKGGDGIERLEAWFCGQAYSLHRHDTYAIGITLSGVQSFRYRGQQRYCLPGQCHVLHPDEEHDGTSATDAGFSYRIVYLDPAVVQQAIGGRPLPFVADPVVKPHGGQVRLLSQLLDMDDQVDELGKVEIATAAAALLRSAASDTSSGARALPIARLSRIREMIVADPTQRHSLDELERVAGLDRWTLARAFRAAYGTSPRRYRTMRQLDRVRTLLRSGMSLSGAAQEAGFADQSHMTRKFKQAYGLSPGRWAAAVG